MISVPAVIHFKILGLIAWHYYDCTVRFIQSVPKIDYAAGEPWAMECCRELAGVQLQPTRPSESMSLDTHRIITDGKGLYHSKSTWLL